MKKKSVACKKNDGLKPSISDINLLEERKYPIVLLSLEEKNPIYREGFLSLVVITEGTAVIRSHDMQFSPISPGCFCFNEKDDQEILSSRDMKYSCLYFLPRQLNAALSFENIRNNDFFLSVTEKQDRDFLIPFLHMDNDSGFIPMGPLLLERVVSLLKSFDKEITEKRDGFWPCRSRSYLIELIFLIFKAYKNNGRDVVRAVDAGLPGRILHYLHGHYSEKILLSEICKRFESNKTTVNKLIRETTGYSVIDYVSRLRIQSACLLLRDTRLPVIEISYRSGYNDVAHFGRMFKKIMGMNPRYYREKFSEHKT